MKSKSFRPDLSDYSLDVGMWPGVTVSYHNGYIYFCRGEIEALIWHSEQSGFYVALDEEMSGDLTRERTTSLAIVIAAITNAWEHFDKYLVDVELGTREQVNPPGMRDTPDSLVIDPEIFYKNIESRWADGEKVFLAGWSEYVPTIKSDPMHFDAYCKHMLRFIDE